LLHGWLETALYQNTVACACYYLTTETKHLLFDKSYPYPFPPHEKTNPQLFHFVIPRILETAPLMTNPQHTPSVATTSPSEKKSPSCPDRRREHDGIPHISDLQYHAVNKSVLTGLLGLYYHIHWRIIYRDSLELVLP
jgi:hypothetical protein